LKVKKKTPQAAVATSLSLQAICKRSDLNGAAGRAAIIALFSRRMNVHR
jgi:hypothetical protein